MQAVLTLFKDSKSFQPITRKRPIGMLPILNRPLIEWHIMNCVNSGIKEIIVIAVENPLTVGEFVRPDTRWGVSIEVLVYKDPYSSLDVLKRISGMVHETTVLIPVETVINLSYERLADIHGEGHGHITKIVSKNMIDFRCDNDAINECVQVKRPESSETGIYISDAVDPQSAVVVDYHWEGNFMAVETPQDLWSANTACVGGLFPDFLGPEYADLKLGQPKIGHHCHIDSTAIIDGPSLIGSYSRINAGARVSNFAVLGEGVIVDQAAKVTASVIFGDTYVGTDASIIKSIVMSNVIMNLDVGVWTSVGDPFLLSGVNKKIIYTVSQKVADKSLAIILLLVTAPVWIGKGLIRLLNRQPFFDLRILMVRDLYFDPASKDAARPCRFFCFNHSGPFLERLPCLIDVLLGKIRLVGVRPLKEEDFEKYQEDWALQRFESLDGLFTPVDAECSEDALEEEKIAVENYYTATRNLEEDIKILWKGLKRLLMGDK
jgi:NDP-sugar pyrophosphorylase family protein